MTVPVEKGRQPKPGTWKIPGKYPFQKERKEVNPSWNVQFDLSWKERKKEATIVTGM